MLRSSLKCTISSSYPQIELSSISSYIDGLLCKTYAMTRQGLQSKLVTWTAFSPKAADFLLTIG